MVRSLFAGIAIAGFLASVNASSIPLDVSEVDLVIDAPLGQASILFGSGQDRINKPMRYNEESMFDGVVDSKNFYSMGIDGVVQIDLNDPAYFVSDATLIEITWDNVYEEGPHREAAEVWWGTADGNYVKGALLLNCDQSFIVSGYSLTDWNVVTPTVNSSDIMTWSTNVPVDARYTSLYIRDVSELAFGNTRSYDGFDIGEIRYSVPEPTSLAFLGLSLLSLAGFYRRKRK